MLPDRNLELFLFKLLRLMINVLNYLILSVVIFKLVLFISLTLFSILFFFSIVYSIVELLC
jgi:hypothetical protein